jgi:hypothetical protein
MKKVRLHTVSSVRDNGQKKVPSLRISGEWLEKLGFQLGRQYVIHEQPGQLVIQLIHPGEGKTCA